MDDLADPIALGRDWGRLYRKSTKKGERGRRISRDQGREGRTPPLARGLSKAKLPKYSQISEVLGRT